MSLPSSSLCEILEAERACCARLAEVVERERQAASAHDLAGLLASNKEREATQAQWNRIADQRRSSLRQSGASLAELAERDSSLRGVRDELAKISQELHRAQQVNRGLVRAVLGGVTGLIDSFQRELPDSRYDSGAGLTGAVPRSGNLALSA